MSMNVKGKRVALVGGAGFIGHNLALSLKRAGAEVSIIDSLQINNVLAFMGNREPKAQRQPYLNYLQERLALIREAEIPLYVQDAREYHSLGKILSEVAPTHVVLLAAVAHANKSNKDPFSTFDHSLRTLENTLDWSRGHLEHFIYFSSSMVYGDFVDGLVTEESICRPKGIYGALKFAGEKMVQAYGEVFNLPYTIVRPSALYGERCVSRRVVQIFLENAVDGKEVVIAGDGSERLDFTYINDLVQGVTRVLANEKSKGEIFNVTFGQSRSVANLREIMMREFPNLKIRTEPRDALMPARGTLSVDKAKAILGYSPEFSLERGVSSYLKWYQANKVTAAPEARSTLIVETENVEIARPVPHEKHDKTETSTPSSTLRS